MPTESAFFFAALLFLAAALGYVFARFGDADEEADARESARADFLRGFRYLLNEEPDRAVDVFTGVERIGAEGLETQLALGAMFRRRGEIERAIRLHQNILERPGLTDTQRQQAGFALADDFLGAGLFDRAEELLLSLRASPAHAAEAAARLLRVAEVTSDWARAVELATAMPHSGGTVAPSQLAHYYCELAGDAGRRQDWGEMSRCLEQAERLEPGKARARLLAADRLQDTGRPAEALAGYGALARQHPELLSELLPRLVGLADPAARDRAMALLADLAVESPAALRAIGVAAIRQPTVTEPVVLDCLERFILAHPVLQQLVDPESLPRLQPADRQALLERIRRAIRQMVAGVPRYRCSDCGYVSLSLQWQCPGCRSWDTVRPVDELFAISPRA